MIKTCQNCKIKFSIEPEDIKFYKKVGVPAPTFCPECRMKRKASFYNMRSLYKRKDSFTKKNIISIYNSNSPFKIYHSKIWWSDKWDPMDYGQEYNFDQQFFKQLEKLILNVPRIYNFDFNSVNCNYCAGVYNCKNCYMCIGNRSEDCLYSMVGLSKGCVDNFFAIESENCYENIICHKNYNLYFSQFTDNCIDSAFLYDCRNCQYCFACVNLRHKKYYIFNKSYSKEEYLRKLKEFDLGSYKNIKKIKESFYKFQLKFPRKFARIRRSINTIGDNIKNVNNCYYCFDSAQEIDNCKYVLAGGWHLKDSYDILDGGTNSELLYEVVTVGDNGQRIFFSINIVQGVYNVEYSNDCYSSSNLFACAGLRHKQYCILNKQYTKKEYEELVPKIKQHMNDMPYTDKKGRIYKYGEFFPSELSPFGYNETIANEYFPLTKEEALKQGYNWYDKPKNEYKSTTKASQLPDHINDVDGSILKEVIECDSKDCSGSGAFRIIPQELKFYKKQNLPLPRLCPDCRHRERIKQRNPLKLWKRKCMKEGCPNTFQTTYAPNRKEIVYCEGCYNKEVS